MRNILFFIAIICVVVIAQKKGGDAIVRAASNMVGKWPYSWDGGDYNGPTHGYKQASSPYCDDRNVVGFDCSGLALFSVYQGVGVKLEHHAQDQYSKCEKCGGKRIPVSQRQPGDLVFFGRSDSSITHVAIYAGNDEMIEAPGHDANCKGRPMQRTALRKSRLIDQCCRLW